jgi:hypothetical protein
VDRGDKVAVLAMRPPLHTQRLMTWINAGNKPDAYAHHLYNHLRTLDRVGCVRILVQAPPADERWARSSTACSARADCSSAISAGRILELRILKGLYCAGLCLQS